MQCCGRLIGPLFVLAALATTGSARAIDAPAASSSVTPVDRSEFYARLVRVDRAQALKDLDLPEGIPAQLARAEPAAAVERLEAKAAAGNGAANVALVRTQHWCASMRGQRPPADRAEAALRNALPADRVPETLGVLEAERAFVERAAAACANAPFNYREIERRLRAAAAAGDPASASELAVFTRDPAQREAFLEQAADGGYAPAQYKLAVNRLFAVQRGETTEKVETIRLLLKQAGQSLPAAKVDLANCMATGCDGHPRDTATAAQFAVDAARDGAPNAYAAMLRMPWRSQLSAAEIAAWQMFADRMNESGCMGVAYLDAKVALTQALAQFEKALPPEELDRARSLAERYWNEFSARARREQQCSE